MSKYEKVLNWLDTYREVAFDLLRIYLGIGLLVRGALFLINPSAYFELLGTAEGGLLTSRPLIALVGIVHLVGGGLMAVGLFTRLAALAQIPILLGAVFLVHFRAGLFAASQSFEFSTLVLFLLVLVFLHGSGQWSLDHYWHHRLRPFSKYVEQFDISSHAAFELLRIYLGIGLFVRGVLFVSDFASFSALLGDSSTAWFAAGALSHYVALAHLVGGTLMALGLLTRVAALVQIPILMGAVFLVHFQGGLFAESQSLEFSVLVLFLLVLIFLYGSGRWSADYYLFVKERPAVDEEAVEAAWAHAHEAPAPAEPELTDEAILTMVKPKVARQHATFTCPLMGEACPVAAADHPRDHPWVTPVRKYGLGGAIYFFGGITGPPKEIQFQCRRCDTIVDRTHSPGEVQKYKYRTR